ncbi:MAG: biotin/lipoyl-binding protein [Prolixibacteraceae bacterium]|nr:biotin/lipoyl-binding protein [Prolixibacteraceae bacterium]
MPFELRIKDRTAKVEILDQQGSFYQVKIGEKLYQIDVTKVESGVYSVIYQGKSINMEMIEGSTSNTYIVNTRSNDYQVAIIDAKTRYLEARKGDHDSGETIISSPMPGKIVRLLVKKGEKVAKGDTVIIVSAMKMESEYKSPVDGIIAKIFVKADDVVDAHQPLVEIEPINEQ